MAPDRTSHGELEIIIQSDGFIFTAHLFHMPMAKSLRTGNPCMGHVRAMESLLEVMCREANAYFAQRG